MIIREHVLNHLPAGPRRIVPWLVLPTTLTEVATASGLSVRSVDDYWRRIRDRLYLPEAGSICVTRIALVRVAYGIDPCFCERR